MKNYGFIGFIAISLLCLNPVYGYDGSSFAPPVDRTPQDTLPVLPTLNINKNDIEKDEKDKVSSIELITRSKKQIQGKHLVMPISFTAYARQDGGVIVSIMLEGKTITANYSPNIDITDIESLGITADNEENKKLTQGDKDVMVSLYKDLESQLTRHTNLDKKFLSTLDLLINFFPKEEKFDVITFKSLNRQKKSQEYVPLKENIDKICNLRGKTNTGVFTANPADSGTIIQPPPQQELTEVVGDPITKCLGRCGIGCESLIDARLRNRQYTQDCFVHDLCVRFHRNSLLDVRLSDCQDEFVSAADDYINAFDCPHYIVGTWQFEYRWDYAPSYSAKANWIIYKNGKFVVRNDVYTSGNRFDGKWELKNNNKFVLTYGFIPGGTKYTGVVSEDDMSMRGTIKAMDGGTGKWTAIKQTTSTDTP